MKTDGVGTEDTQNEDTVTSKTLVYVRSLRRNPVVLGLAGHSNVERGSEHVLTFSSQGSVDNVRSQVLVPPPTMKTLVWECTGEEDRNGKRSEGMTKEDLREFFSRHTEKKTLRLESSLLKVVHKVMT